MKRVLTYGTFDLLHRGHVNLLRRARQLGDFLVVGLSTDDFNETKGKHCYYSYSERKIVLESVRWVDMVVPEESWEQKERDVVVHGVSVMVMGDDWEGRFDYLSRHCEVVYLPRTAGISTTKVKSDLREWLS